MAFGSNNPFLKEEKFSNILDAQVVEEHMTVSGAVNKSLILSGLLLITAAIGYMMPNMIFLWGGVIGGFIAALVTSFKPHLANITAPIYAVLEGLAVGVISAVYAAAYEGIVFHAFISTVGILFAMLMIYKSRIIEVTDKLRFGILMATAGIALVYLVDIVLMFFGIRMPMIHEGGTFGIVFSVGVIVVATLNLLVDFDNIEKGAQFGAPKYMELWNGTPQWVY